MAGAPGRHGHAKKLKILETMQMQHGWLETFVIEFLIVRGKDRDTRIQLSLQPRVWRTCLNVQIEAEEWLEGGHTDRRAIAVAKVQAGSPEDLRPYQIETSSWLVLPVHGAQK
jgi:hypothetical protein